MRCFTNRHHVCLNDFSSCTDIFQSDVIRLANHTSLWTMMENSQNPLSFSSVCSTLAIVVSLTYLFEISLRLPFPPLLLKHPLQLDTDHCSAFGRPLRLSTWSTLVAQTQEGTVRESGVCQLMLGDTFLFMFSSHYF